MGVFFNTESIYLMIKISQKSQEVYLALPDLFTVTVRHPSLPIVNQLILSLSLMKTLCLTLLSGPYLPLFCGQITTGH